MTFHVPIFILPNHQIKSSEKIKQGRDYVWEVILVTASPFTKSRNQYAKENIGGSFSLGGRQNLAS